MLTLKLLDDVEVWAGLEEEQGTLVQHHHPGGEYFTILTTGSAVQGMTAQLRWPGLGCPHVGAFQAPPCCLPALLPWGWLGSKRLPSLLPHHIRNGALWCARKRDTEASGMSLDLAAGPSSVSILRASVSPCNMVALRPQDPFQL